MVLKGGDCSNGYREQKTVVEAVKYDQPQCKKE